MAIKHSPGCGCCVDLTCCSVTVAKPYGALSYSGGASQGAISSLTGIADTSFDSAWDFSLAPSYDPADPNVLPANSEITFEVQSCCYDFHFEVEVFDFTDGTTTPFNENHVLDIFSGVMQSRIYENGRTSLYSRANFASDVDGTVYHGRSGRDLTYRAVQGASWAATGSTCEEIYDFSISEYRKLTASDYPLSSYSYRGIRSCGQFPTDWADTSSRTNYLTLKTYDRPITIGGIVIRTGVSTEVTDGEGTTYISHWLGTGSTDGKQCVRIFGQNHTTSDPTREFGPNDYVTETDTSSTQTYSGLFDNGSEAHGSVALVRKSGQITKTGYGSTTYEWTLNNDLYGPPYPAMTASASIEMDHSIKNGSYDWKLVDSRSGVFPGTRDVDAAGIAAWNTWCDNVATDNWQHKYARPLYHYYIFTMPKICSVWPDPTNCATSGGTGFPHNDIRTECASTNAIATYSSTGTGTIDWFGTGTSLPCMYDTTRDFTANESVFPYNTNGGWEPGNFTKPLYVDTTSGTNKASTGLTLLGGNWRFSDPSPWIVSSAIDQIDPANPVLFTEPVFNTWAHSWYQLDDDMESRVIGMMLGDQYHGYPSSGSPAGYDPADRSVDGLLNFHFTEQSTASSGNFVYGSTTTGSWSVTGTWTGTTKIFWDIRKGKTQFSNCIARVGKGKIFDKCVTSLSVTEEVRQDIGGVITLTSSTTNSSTAASYDTDATYNGVYRNLNPKTDGNFYLFDTSGGNKEGSRWKDECPAMQDIMIGSDEYRVVLSDNPLGFWVWNQTTNDVYEPYGSSSDYFTETVVTCGERVIQFKTGQDTIAGTIHVIEIRTIEAK